MTTVRARVPPAGLSAPDEPTKPRRAARRRRASTASRIGRALTRFRLEHERRVVDLLAPDAKDVNGSAPEIMHGMLAVSFDDDSDPDPPPAAKT